MSVAWSRGRSPRGVPYSRDSHRVVLEQNPEGPRVIAGPATHVAGQRSDRSLVVSESQGLCRGLVIPVSRGGGWELGGGAQCPASPLSPPADPPAPGSPRHGGSLRSTPDSSSQSRPPFLFLIDDVSLGSCVLRVSRAPARTLSTSPEPQSAPRQSQARGVCLPDPFPGAPIQRGENAGGPTPNSPGPQAFAGRPPACPSPARTCPLHLFPTQRPGALLTDQDMPSCGPPRGSLGSLLWGSLPSHHPSRPLCCLWESPGSSLWSPHGSPVSSAFWHNL